MVVVRDTRKGVPLIDLQPDYRCFFSVDLSQAGCGLPSVNAPNFDDSFLSIKSMTEQEADMYSSALARAFRNRWRELQNG